MSPTTSRPASHGRRASLLPPTAGAPPRAPRCLRRVSQQILLRRITSPWRAAAGQPATAPPTPTTRGRHPATEPPSPPSECAAAAYNPPDRAAPASPPPRETLHLRRAPLRRGPTSVVTLRPQPSARPRPPPPSSPPASLHQECRIRPPSTESGATGRREARHHHRAQPRGSPASTARRRGPQLHRAPLGAQPPLYDVGRPPPPHARLPLASVDPAGVRPLLCITCIRWRQHRSRPQTRLLPSAMAASLQR